MPSSASVRFDVANWQIKQQSEHRIVWFNRVPDILILEFSPDPVNLPTDLQNIAGIRSFIERMVGQNGGAVISVERIHCDKLEAIKSLFKYRQSASARRSPLGTVYAGLYILPFADFHYLLKIQCNEYGNTGLRETHFAQHSAPDYQHMTSMQERLADVAHSKVVVSPSDDVQYDAAFPHHPLSRLRTYLRHIEATFEADEGLKIARPFRYNPEPNGL